MVVCEFGYSMSSNKKTIRTINGSLLPNGFCLAAGQAWRMPLFRHPVKINRQFKTNNDNISWITKGPLTCVICSTLVPEKRGFVSPCAVSPVRSRNDDKAHLTWPDLTRHVLKMNLHHWVKSIWTPTITSPSVSSPNCCHKMKNTFLIVYGML